MIPEEPSLEDRLAQLGVPGLVPVNDVEANKICGRGYGHHLSLYTALRRLRSYVQSNRQLLIKKFCREMMVYFTSTLEEIMRLS